MRTGVTAVESKNRADWFALIVDASCGDGAFDVVGASRVALVADAWTEASAPIRGIIPTLLAGALRNTRTQSTGITYGVRASARWIRLANRWPTPLVKRGQPEARPVRLTAGVSRHARIVVSTGGRNAVAPTAWRAAEIAARLYGVGDTSWWPADALVRG